VPRARCLAGLASTLTAEPWALTREDLAEVAGQGLDAEQAEVAVTVVSMFNYFTRVADATGIEFDYQTPLPAFEPDRSQLAASRPGRPSARRDTPRTRRHRPGRLGAAWKSWRAYVLETDEPLSRRQRRLLASVVAEEAADWEGAEALSPGESRGDADGLLAGFARKLSRQPWRMEAGDLERLRAAGYPDLAVLHVIAVVAHQNADSRLVAGLAAIGGT
jgi:uncharacterized protein YciW